MQITIINRMDKYNTTKTAVQNILTNNTPHSIGSLARKTNVSRKYIQYILASNSELFEKYILLKLVLGDGVI